MMTPTRIVRFLGFVGLVAFLGLAMTSMSTIQAQNDDKLPPAPPIAAELSKPVIVSQATDEPAPAAVPAPKPAVPAVEPIPLPAPAETPEAKPAAPAPAPSAAPTPVELKGNAATELPAIAESPEGAPIPRAPEPKGLEAPAIAAEPQPIAEAAPAKAMTMDLAFPIASNDPDSQARSFVERNRKEAEAQLKALNTEAAQLRARLSKIESGIRRWQALADAMEKSEDAAASVGSGETLETLEPLPRAKEAFRSSKRKTTVIQSTPDEPVTRAQFVPAPQPR
ncbi:hypothetical protein [Paludisphaera borealis]|uniref:Uncharacterized protein n=1 Tax=Paludisphaera borealis TaxID=1387353 RepID=A0A1U7CU49_9BACT|nr:hypothetical protein [Paludisphaera borealis]APW62426.1 hypothetical protein BSF38_03970 [Paludisphaera borealis]